MSLLKTLNKSQKDAVKCAGGPTLVIAGAGCGKTCVLTNRIAYLVKNEGVDSENILTIAFTNKEAEKISKELESLISKKSNNVKVCTFNKFCIDILREYIDQMGYQTNFSIYDQEDKKKIVKDCMNALNINEQKILTKTIIDYIADKKNKSISPDEAKENATDNTEKKIAKAYALYEETLLENNALDYDDLTYKTLKLFKENPKILKAYQKQYPYILIDEYQDIRTIEYKLLIELLDKNKNLFAVGNDDEGIFKAKGADASHIENFAKEFKKGQIITLEDNFRSTKNIVDMSNAVIANNTERIEKEMTTKCDAGSLTTLYYAYDERDEASYIVNNITDKVITEDASYGDFAILYRTNMQARIIEEQLASENVPYRVYGGQKFYERKEVKDIVSYLKVLLNDKDELSIRRVINIPKRNIGNTTLDKIDACAKKHKLYLYEALRDCSNYSEISKLSYKIERFTLIVEELKEMLETHSIVDVISTLIDRTNYIKMLEDEETQDARDRIENINELVKRAAFFEENAKYAEDATLERFLEDMILVEDTKYEDRDDVVKLMTIPFAKGEEFKTTYLIGFEDGIFPSYLSIFEDKENEIEEERRLLYVALTRAKESMHITYTKSRIKNGQVNHNKVSRFYEELPKDLFEEKKKKVKKLEINMDIIEEKTTPMLHSSIKSSVEQNIALSSSKENVSMNFKVGEKFGHKKFGTGKIKEIVQEGSQYALKVKFDGFGEKKMMFNEKTAIFFQKY